MFHATAPTVKTNHSSYYHLPYDIVEEMVVQVRPPSTVLSRDEELRAIELMAQPTLSETKSSWAMFSKLSPGESFIQ